MKSRLHYIAVMLLLFCANASFAQYSSLSLSWNINAYEDLTYVNSKGEKMPYRLLKPTVIEPGKKYPLVIMLHGQGEGIGSSCSNKNGVNVCNLGWGGKMHLDSINKYPSYVVFPQTYGGGWSSSGSSGVFPEDPQPPVRLLTELLSTLFTSYSVDLNRVYIHGLSGGGLGVWEMLLRYPALFAAASPHSAGSNAGKAYSIVHNPLWTIQGEIDSNPSAGYTKSMMDSLQKYGREPIYTLDVNTGKQKWPNPKTTAGRPIYTLIPNAGHVVWPQLYNSPSWMAWMYHQNKLNITVFGSPDIYAGDSVRLGISPGFDAYEWSNGAVTNQITVKEAGDYRVRFRRKTAYWTGESVWTEWSEPVKIRILPGSKDITPPAAPGNVLLVDRTSMAAYLSWRRSTDNVGVAGYEVYSGGKVVAVTTDTTVIVNDLQPNTRYFFNVKAYDAAGNRSAFSNQVNTTTDKVVYGVNYSYYEGSWTSIPNFNTLTPKKTGTIENFYIRPKARGDNFAFKFEGYIDIAVAGAYTFYSNSDDGSKVFLDNIQVINNDNVHEVTEKAGSINLSKGKHAILITYFEGVGLDILEIKYSGPGIAKQLIPTTSLYVTNQPDNTPPAAPGGLIATGKSSGTADLFWKSSSDDQGIAGYEIYTNGVFTLYTPLLNATVEGLEPNTVYNFTVKARDASGNRSSASNTVTVTTLDRINGVRFSYYEGSFSVVPDFDTLAIQRKGTVNNFDLSPRLRDDLFAFKFESYIDLPANGAYTFYTSSDDGSLLYINNQLVVNNDGTHASRERSGTISLMKGRYPIRIAFFDKTGQEIMDVKYSGPGIAKMNIPDTVLFLKGSAGSTNNNPVLPPLANKTVREGDSLLVAFSATDADGDDIALSAPGLPAFGIFTDNHNGTGRIVFKPGSDDAGSYTITILASDGKGGTDSKSFSLTVTGQTNQTNLVLYRINAGGYQLPATGNSSLAWGLDSYSNPSSYCNVSEAGNKTLIGTDPVILSPGVPATTPADLFKSERALGTGTTNTLSYNLPVASGSEVEVRLYFAENWFNEPNKRKFNIAIEDELKLTDFDIYAEAGHDVGMMKSYTATSDGAININLIKVLQNPKINGIEIVCLNDVCNRNNIQIARQGALIPEVVTEGRVSAYPNPFVNHISVDVSSAELQSGIVKIYNNLGELVRELSVSLNNAAGVSIDMSGYPVGIYFLKVYSGEGDLKETVRLVKH